MEKLIKTEEKKEIEEEFSFKKFFIPLTTGKAIHWIILIGIVVFFNSLFNEFVWDDLGYIITYTDIHSFNLFHLFGNNIFNSFGYYRPLTATYFSFLFNIFGFTPFYYHAIQLLIHLCNTVLFFLFLANFYKKKTALILSLIFLVHPMQVESVSYIAQASSVLCFFFGILAVFLSTKTAISKKRMFLIFFLILLSLLIKEAGFVFIPFVLLYRYLYKKGKLLTCSIASVVTTVVYFCIRFFIGNDYFSGQHFVPIAQLNFSLRLLAIPKILFYYLKTVIYPKDLAISQNWVVTHATVNDFFLPLIFVMVFIAISIFYGKKIEKTKRRSYLFFAMWFVLSISFYLQIFPLDMTVADRWFYLPMAGLLGMGGILLESNIFTKTKNAQIVLNVCLLVIIFSLAVRTIVRNADWQTPESLYSHDILVVDDYNKEGHLAAELLQQGNLNSALYHYQQSLQLLPYETTFAQIGYIYERVGKYRLAKAYYFKALQTKSTVSPPYKHEENTYDFLARLFVLHDNPSTAQQYINQGLSEYPNSVTLLILEGLDQYRLHNRQQALTALKKAYILLSPNPTKSSIVQTLYNQIYTNQPINFPIETLY